jgi:diguanylate cyclase (GGDEF)-like protein
LTLHIPTLMLALLLGFLLLTLELGVSQRGARARPELKLWTRGCWAFLLGLVALVARGWIPLWLSILLGNALICLGMVAYVHALYQHLLAAPAPRWLMQVQPGLWLALLLMLDWPLNRRTALTSVFSATLLLPAVWVIARHGWGAERSLRTVALTMATAIAALLLRALHAWFNPADYNDILQASLGQGLTFLVAFMCLVGAGFGFVLAVFERVASRMEEMATHDGLTGCWNRSTTDTLLEHELQRARRSGAPVAFVLLDLDHFKQVNDLHGHRTGDAVLRGFAATVRARLRASDVFGRTGGEEFGIVLPDTDVAGARWLVEDIRRAVEAAQFSNTRGHPVRITVSAGLAVADARGVVSGDRLYGHADQSLYEAKHAGRNRVEVYGISTGASAMLPLE